MRRKDGRGRRARLSVIIALVLVVLLTISGTVLRMRSRDMAPAAAFKSFITDTFSFE